MDCSSVFESKAGLKARVNISRDLHFFQQFLTEVWLASDTKKRLLCTTISAKLTPIEKN